MKTEFKNLKDFNIKGCVLVTRFIKDYKSVKNLAFWNCICDCGNAFIKREDLIRRLLRTNETILCSSCGHNKASKRCILSNNIGVKKRVFRAYKYGAKARGINFYLTENEVYDLISRPCVYCGQEPYEHADKNYSDVPYYRTGIDRINNTDDYRLSTVVPCCETCNKMKMLLNRDEFFKQLYKILKFQGTFNDQSDSSYTQVSGNRNHLINVRC